MLSKANFKVHHSLDGDSLTFIALRTEREKKKVSIFTVLKAQSDAVKNVLDLEDVVLILDFFIPRSYAMSKSSTSLVC